MPDEEAVREDPKLYDAWIGLAKVHRFKGNFRDALAALDGAKKALDLAASPSDDRRRTDLAALRRLYERERDEPAEAREALSDAQDAAERKDWAAARASIASARKFLDAARVAADDPLRLAVDALAERVEREGK